MPDGVVTTLAGSGQAAHKDGYGRHACFYNPCGIAIDYVANDVLYVSDYSNNCVRAVSRSGLVSTIAREAEAPLDSPYGIAVHIDSHLPTSSSEVTIYVSSYHSHASHGFAPSWAHVFPHVIPHAIPHVGGHASSRCKGGWDLPFRAIF